jgi:IS30 family transposase
MKQMTKEKREQILELRKAGMGYQAIAKEVGESVRMGFINLQYLLMN